MPFASIHGCPCTYISIAAACELGQLTVTVGSQRVPLLAFLAPRQIFSCLMFGRVCDLKLMVCYAITWPPLEPYTSASLDSESADLLQ